MLKVDKSRSKVRLLVLIKWLYQKVLSNENFQSSQKQELRDDLPDILKLVKGVLCGQKIQISFQ